jgi:hypothetical protein
VQVWFTFKNWVLESSYDTINMAIVNKYFKEYPEDKKKQIGKFQSHCKRGY